MRNELFLFCDRQLHISNLLIDLHIIKPVEIKGFRNPITNRREILVQVYEAPEFIAKRLQKIIDKAITEDGIVVRDRCVNLNYISLD